MPLNTIPDFTGTNASSVHSALKTALAEANVEFLRRSNPDLDTNTMTNDLDLNSNDLLNGGAGQLASLTLAGNLVTVNTLNAVNAVRSYPSVAQAKAATDLVLGQIFFVQGRPAPYVVVAAATGTADEGVFFDLTGVNLQAQALHDGRISSLQYAPGGGVVDETTEIQAWFDYVADNNLEGVLGGSHAVSTIVLDGKNGFKISGRGALVGNATSATDAVLELKSCTDMEWQKGIYINASYKTEYSAGVKVWADNTPTGGLSTFAISIVGAPLAWQFGDSSEPDALGFSEMVVRDGYTFGCPAVCDVIGSQSVVTFQGYQLLSTLGTNPPGWSALNRRVLRVIGSSVLITGSELTLNDVTTGVCMDVRPINSPGFDNVYGKITISNTLIETSSQLATATNPDAVVLAGSPITKGAISLHQCKGVHTQDAFAFVDLAADYEGDFIMEDCNFFNTVARSQANINAAGNANIYVKDQSFGTNFIQGLSGITGGIVHFDRREILHVNNLNGQSIPNAAATVLNYTTTVVTSDTGRFNTGYSAGTFTVPTGGLRSVEVHTQIVLSGTSPANSELYVDVDGTAYGVSKDTDFHQNTIHIGDLNAGQTLRVRFFNVSAGAKTAPTDVKEFFKIIARN